jgi:hypothetical protein
MNPLPLVNLLLAEIDKIKISVCFGCDNARTLPNHGDSPFTCGTVGEPLRALYELVCMFAILQFSDQWSKSY